MKKISSYIITIFIIFIIGNKAVFADNVITLDKNNVIIGINYQLTLNVERDQSFSPSDVVWSSSNYSVANVSNGTVTGISSGMAIITASINDYKATCVVNVIDNYIRITNLSFGTSFEELTINQSKKLNVTITPNNASDQRLLYSSSNTQIVSVDNSGNVRGLAEGTAIITVTSSLGDVKASLLVNVSDKISLNSISINDTLSLNEQATSLLSVTFNPGNATNKKITWKSSNPDIATVDSSGRVTGVKAGTTIIQAISNDGGHVASCNVTVVALDKTLKEISLNQKELTMNLNDEETLTVIFNPTYANDLSVKWESSDNKIVSVSDGKIKALKPGKAQIKVTNEKTKLTATCQITVLSPPIEEISFEKDSQDIYINSKTELKTVSKPENTAINNPIWTSSDESVATVTDGIVTALKIGSAIITVSNEDGSISAQTTVNVIQKPVESETLKISVQGYQLNFDPKVKDYTLKIGNESSLVFDINLDKKKYTINGNRDLKNGSIITITISDKDKTQYIINIKKKETYTIPFIIIISVLLLLNIIRMLIKNKKK